MGEWGKWWSSRGHDQNVKCTFCGRNVPKHKAVQVNIGGRLTRDIYELAEVVSMGGSKGYSCMSCAKHRHLVKDGIHTTEKEKLAKRRAHDKREMEKVMVKVRELEKKERTQKTADSQGHPPNQRPIEKKSRFEAPKTEVVKSPASAPVQEAPKVDQSSNPEQS